MRKGGDWLNQGKKGLNRWKGKKGEQVIEEKRGKRKDEQLNGEGIT